MNEIRKITIIGAGCVANAFAEEMHAKGFVISEIVGRREEAVLKLAAKVDAHPNIADYQNINTTSDLYILSVKDHVIHELAPLIKTFNKLLVHTSGSVDMKVLAAGSTNYGVLYPLQTFSRERKPDFAEIPFFVIANTRESEQLLYNFASTLSQRVEILDDEKRRVIHLSAVFTCNFTNYMLTHAKGIMDTADLDFQLMKALAKETINKAFDNGPEYSQTGPAKRNDKSIIKRHLAMLSKDRRKLYDLISKMIIKDYNA